MMSQPKGKPSRAARSLCHLARPSPRPPAFEIFLLLDTLIFCNSQFILHRIEIDHRAAATLEFMMETNSKMPDAPPSPSDDSSTCSTEYTLLVSLTSIEKASNEKIRNYKIDNVEKIMRLKKKLDKPGANIEEIEAELKQCHIKSEEIDKEWLQRGVFHGLFAPKIVSVCGSLESSFNDDDLSVMTSDDDDEDSNNMNNILSQILQIGEQEKEEEGRKKNKGLRTLSSSDVNREKMTPKGPVSRMTKKQERHLTKRNV